MDAATIIHDWKRRLLALANCHEYAYRYTPQHLLNRRHVELTTFYGYSESLVARAEERLNARFPAVFRQYLLEMAQPGLLFRGSELPGPSEFEQFRDDASELMAATDANLKLPPEAVVFLFHQGYTFLYVLATGGFDGPVMGWTEMDGAPQQAAATFADLIEAELQRMEKDCQAVRDLHPTLLPKSWWAFWK